MLIAKIKRVTPQGERLTVNKTCEMLFFAYIIYFLAIHCKKGYRFSRLQPGCHLPNFPWPGIIQLFPASGSLVSDIPSGDGKAAIVFLQCMKNIGKRILLELSMLID